MGLPCLIQHTGSLSVSPSAGPLGGPSLLDLLNSSFVNTYNARSSDALTIVGATDLSPYVLSLGSITKVRMIGLRVNSGTIKMLVTSAAGTDQAIRQSSVFLWNAPYSGDEITAISFVGTADIEICIAGDVA